MRTTTNRRQFLENAAGAALAIQLSGSLAWAADDTLAELRKYADPLALAKNGSLPEAENAFFPLNAAAKLLTDEPAAESETEQYFRFDQPNAERDGPMAAWLDKNRRAIELVDQAVQLDKLEFPGTAWQDDRFDCISTYRRLSRFLRLHAQRLAGQGKLTAAVDASRTASSALRLLSDGGGVCIEYVVASGFEMACWESNRHLAQLPNFDANAVRRLLEGLPPQRDTFGGVRRALQAEFTYFMLPQLAKTVGAEVDQTLRIFIDWKEIPKAPLILSRQEYEARCAKLMLLFAGHSNPYNVVDTVKRGSAKCVSDMHEMDLPWSKNQAHAPNPLAQELAAWPVELNLDSMGASGDADKVTPARLADARLKLSNVNNPIGKKSLISDFVDGLVMHRAALSKQARYDGTRLFLAVRVYKLEHSELPVNLEQLVTERILDSLPLDPFSNRQFQYAREQKAIWSVGWGGKVAPGKAPDDIDGDDECHLWQFDAA